MYLRIMLPKGILVDEEIQQVVTESDMGEICLESKHKDFGAALVPNLLTYFDGFGDDFYVAVDSGILVKRGQLISLATKCAIAGDPDLLEDEVSKMRKRYIAAQEAACRANPYPEEAASLCFAG